MAKAERAQVGQPQLRPADLGGATAAALTIAGATLKESRFGGVKWSLAFVEFPEREMWLNKTGLNAVIDHYGDDTERWYKKLLPVVAVTVSVAGAQKFVVQVAENWDAVLLLASKATATAKKSRK